MKWAWLVIASALWTATANAQENVSVPYAPAVPMRLAIAEVMTSSGGEPVHVNYSLELQRQLGEARTYEAVWTVLSVEGRDPSRSDELARLVGRPISMTLGEAGQPTGMSEGDYFAFETEREGTLMAQRLAAPLTFMAVCHNANSPIGEPVVAQGERGGGELVMTWRMERLLQSLEGGVARLTFSNESIFHRGSADGEVVHRTTQRIQCVVDAQTGIARSVSVQSTAETESGPFVMHSEIVVSPQ